MFDALDRIREKPREQRQAIALSIAAVVTGVVFILWVISFFSSMQDSKEIIVPSESEFGFDTFVDSFQEASDVIQQGVGSVREQFEFINNELQKEGIVEVDSEVEGSTAEEDSLTIPPVIQETEVTPSGIEIIKVEE